MSTTRTQLVIDALQSALAHYNAAMAIPSTIMMDLHLAQHSMYWGLCHYFAKNNPAIDRMVMDELADDLIFPPHGHGDFTFDIPRELKTVQDVQHLAIAPRIEWMQKTLARLQQQLKQSA
jgi:hypothetical protein